LIFRRFDVNTDALHLYVDAQFISPYAMSVYVALVEKGLPFGITTVDLTAGENRTARFAERSLTQRVPLLNHGDFSLTESSAIAEYLDDVFSGAALYPSQPRARARARQLQAWLRSDLMALRIERPTEVVFFGEKRPPLSMAGQAAADKLVSVAATVILDRDDHACGQWSIVDVDLALMIQRLALHGDSMPLHLISYADHQWRRPSVQQWLTRVTERRAA